MYLYPQQNINTYCTIKQQQQQQNNQKTKLKSSKENIQTLRPLNSPTTYSEKFLCICSLFLPLNKQHKPRLRQIPTGASGVASSHIVEGIASVLHPVSPLINSGPSQLDHFLTLSACWLSLSFIKATRALKSSWCFSFSKYYLHLSVHFNLSILKGVSLHCLYSLLNPTELCFALDTKIILLHYCPSIIHSSFLIVLMCWWYGTFDFPLFWGYCAADHVLSEFSYRLFFPYFIHFLFYHHIF